MLGMTWAPQGVATTYNLKPSPSPNTKEEQVTMYECHSHHVHEHDSGPSGPSRECEPGMASSRTVPGVPLRVPSSWAPASSPAASAGEGRDKQSCVTASGRKAT